VLQLNLKKSHNVNESVSHDKWLFEKREEKNQRESKIDDKKPIIEGVLSVVIKNLLWNWNNELHWNET
jgi:hypothetical protein